MADDDGELPRDPIRLIDAVIDQQISKREPVMVLHLTESDWTQLRDFKTQNPGYHGVRTADDPRPRYRLIPIARSLRDWSFAELAMTHANGEVRARWIPIDHANLVAGDPGEAASATSVPAGPPDYGRERDGQGNVLDDGSPGDAPLTAGSYSAHDFDGGSYETPAAGAPPEIPSARPTALNFSVTGGKIVVDRETARSDADEASVLAILGVAHSVLANLAHSTSNANPSLFRRLERLRSALPDDMPTLEDVFRFGREADVLRSLLARMDPGELDPDTSAEIDELAVWLTRFASQFPEWREFLRNARASQLTPEQVRAAPRAGVIVVQAIEASDGREVVGEGVATAFSEMVDASAYLIGTPDDPFNVIAAGGDLLAAELVESVDNLLKAASTIARRAYFGRFAQGAVSEWDRLSEADGKRAVRWLRRAFFGATGAAGGGALWHMLMVTYPDVFGPLNPVVQFIRSIGV